MIRFIKWLFTGDSHLHEWEVYSTFKVERKRIEYKTEGYVLRCKHCGEMKEFILDD